MARIRTIKPEFFTSLTVASLPVEARLTFIGLWTHADDEGRCVDDARLIKAALWPLDDRTIDDIGTDLAALAACGLVTRYTLHEDSGRTHGGLSERSFLAITSWREHQVISRPTKSKLPAPEEGAIRPLTCTIEDSRSTHGGLSEDSTQERKGKEGKGKEVARAPRSPSGTDDPDFVTFYEEAFPLKADRGNALAKWKIARKKADAETLISAAWAYRRDPERKAQFTKKPGNWLRDECWLNEKPAQPTLAIAGRPEITAERAEWLRRNQWAM